MDSECGFCGRAESARRRVFCEDCRTHHGVCADCHDEVAAQTDVYRVIA